MLRALLACRTPTSTPLCHDLAANRVLANVLSAHVGARPDAGGGEPGLGAHMRREIEWCRGLAITIDGDVVTAAVDIYDAELVAASDARRLPAIARLGPDLPADGLDVEALAARLLAEGARPSADVLLDQSVLAGLGNVCR